MENLKKRMFIELDELGNILSTKPLVASQSVQSLSDGLYVDYKGSDWILEDDFSLLSQKVIYSGQSEKIIISETKSTVNRKTSSIGLTLEYKFLKTAISQAFDTTITESKEFKNEINLSSPEGSDTLYKVYATYKRYDVMLIKNNQIFQSGTVFEIFDKQTIPYTYSSGSTFDPNTVILREPTSVTTPIEGSIWEIIDIREGANNLVTGRSISNGSAQLFNLENNLLVNQFHYTSPSCNELFFVFNINTSGEYIFYTGIAVDIVLYKLSYPTKDKLEKVEIKLADGVNDNYIIRTIPGGNYVLKLSTKNSTSNRYGFIIQKN